MIDRLRRHWLLLLFVVALLVNLAIYWPRKGDPAALPGARPPGPPSGLLLDASAPDAPQREAAFQAMLAKLPTAQRTAIEERVAADKAFFATLKDLPEAERREKMQEHFAQNPPPPLPGMTDNPPPGPGGPGGGPGAHIPPPDVRREMDRNIANSQRTAPAP